MKDKEAYKKRLEQIKAGSTVTFKKCKECQLLLDIGDFKKRSCKGLSYIEGKCKKCQNIIDRNKQTAMDVLNPTRKITRVEYLKQYRNLNKEKIKSLRKSWDKSPKGKACKARNYKRYYIKNRQYSEKYKAYKRTYRAKNKKWLLPKAREQAKKWRVANLEKSRAIERKSSALNVNILSDGYIVTLIRQQTKKSTATIKQSPAIIEVKRLQVQLKRKTYETERKIASS